MIIRFQTLYLILLLFENTNLSMRQNYYSHQIFVNVMFPFSKRFIYFFTLCATGRPGGKVHRKESRKRVEKRQVRSPQEENGSGMLLRQQKKNVNNQDKRLY